MEWLKSHIVDDMSVIWKRWSVKIVAAQAVVLATWAALTLAGLAPTVPEWLKWAAFLIFSVAALAVAPLKQSNLPPQ